ncbi:protein DDI1 homolog 1-like isoform X1 [Rhodnius prolixus]
MLNEQPLMENETNSLNVDLKNLVFFPKTKKINNTRAADLNVKTLVQERKNSEAKNLADYKKEFIYIITHLLSNDIEFLCYFEKIDPVTINALLNHQLKPNDLIELFQLYLNTSEFIINPSTEAIRHRLTNSDMQTIVHKNVRNHRKAARILLPEFFNHTQWLYINCKVNGFPAIALVDSAAEITTMTETLAQKIGCLRLVDSKYGGSAKGLGTQRIHGRINLALLTIEDVVFLASFAIVNTDHVEIIIGLDNLKKHKCLIDFGNNLLHIKATNTKTPFLKNDELPPSLRRITSNQTES